jgi:phage tail sheath protein FI
MPATLTYPGVYVDEIPTGGARPIAAVPTAIGAFVGPVPRGPTDAKHLTSWDDFERLYGGIAPDNPLSTAVYYFFLNGGGETKVVRTIGKDAVSATIQLKGGPKLEARSPGAAINGTLRARVDYDAEDFDPEEKDPKKLYNLTIRDTSTGVQERFVSISTEAASSHWVPKALKGSSLVKPVDPKASWALRPDAHAQVKPGTDPFADEPKLAEGATGDAYTRAAGGTDGGAVPDYAAAFAQLRRTDIFNILCVLPATHGEDLPDGVLTDAGALCLARRAFMIVDPPKAWTAVDAAVDKRETEITGTTFAASAAVYFPRLVSTDGEDTEIGPCGAIAGLYARTDAQRGVWKAPAGTEAGLAGVKRLTVTLTDRENGRLNPLGINCLRTFPGIGKVSWGARTMRGADTILDDPSWRYVPIRRLALFIEESLYRGTQFVVFEPNDEPLWSSIRLTVGSFMNGLFRQGAFQGTTPREAYLVKCDKDNNPQADIDRGIVNILVGFAPLKPAEFVLVHIQQLAGQVQT